LGAAAEADHQPPLANPAIPGSGACGRVGPQPSWRLHQATMLRRCRDSTSTAMTISHTPTTGSTNSTAPSAASAPTTPTSPIVTTDASPTNGTRVLTSAKTTTAPI